VKASTATNRSTRRGGLQEYRAKRDFRRTPEPAGERDVHADGELIYCIQRHAARQLHYDFRLEWDGVLKSWAIPKGPSLDPAVKRLAVQTEDHPIEYGNFEGSIPTGEYGAGEVLLWDRGTWEPGGDATRALASGKLRFELHGAKLHGDWLLVRLEGDQWLLRKLDDEEARAGDGDHVIMDRPESVRETAPRTTTARRAAERSPLPDFIAPQLATLTSEPPAGDGWLYEIKHDGYRMGARLTRDATRLFSRNGNDWSARLGPLETRIKGLRLGTGWLDGEIVVSDGTGRTSFQALQKALDRDPGRIEFVVFDVLHWDGVDQRGRPLRERVELLEQIFKGVDTAGPVRLSQHLKGNGAEAWKAACRLGLEGLIAKRLDSAYINGRSNTWLKLKCRAGQEFVVGGFTEPAGSRAGFGALLVGVRAPDGQLDYVGRVGSGFDHSNLRSLRRKLDQLQVERSPFRQPPRLRADRVHWVRPLLVAQLEFAEWTAGGQLRQASFQGLREDKDARAVERETPRRAAARARTVQKVTHPERIVYSRPRATKLDVVRYYEEVAAVMLPHLRDRPLAMVRCPQGIAQPCFFQKHIGVKLPAGTRGVPIRTNTGEDDYVVIRDAAGIAGLAQYGTIEFHTWGSVASRLEYADRLTFDLDPDADVAWPRLVEAALLTREFIAEFGLTGFLKTTGGKGLHVVAPIKPNRDWEAVRSFTQAVAQRLAAGAPDRYTARMAKARRTGRIFIDYLRNGRGATAICAYSLRAREGAPVSVPVPWDALNPRRDLRGERFNLRNLDEHLQWSLAAWKDYDKRRATLTLASLRALSGED
jgi:bifunctional non-homologous end joining protein LigD